jgi:hypothetical protein
MLQREEEPELFITIPTGLQVGTPGNIWIPFLMFALASKTHWTYPVRTTTILNALQIWPGERFTRAVNTELPDFSSIYQHWWLC